MASQAPALAKLSRPRLYGALPRERLFGTIDQLRWHPVVWLAGHPGAGKTTLIASYLESRRLGGIWFQVDPGDADPAAFFYYLKLAADAPDLPLLAPEYLADLPGFTRRFFRQLFGGFGRNDVVVLDNAQELPETSPTASLLATAFEEVPPGVNVIVISREVPPTRLARLAVNRKVAVLGWDELRFTDDETRTLVETRFAITDDQLRLVQGRCDGWVAGLTLLMERARRSGDLTQADGFGPLPAVFDYFAGLLLDQASDRTRRTLMALSYLPFFTSELASRASGDPEAGQLLDQLFRRHLFVHRRESAEGTYTFHALFREFLRSRAEASMTVDEVRDLRVTSARLFRDRGLVQEALDLFAQARDWDSVASMIESEADALIRQGRGATVREWLSRLPNPVVDASASLQYWLGESWQAVDNERARSRLSAAFQLFVRDGNHLGQVSVASAMIESYWLTYRDFSQTDPWRAILEPLLAGGLPFPNVRMEVRASTAWLMTAANRNPDGALIGKVSGRLRQLLDIDLDDDQRLLVGTLLLGVLLLTPDSTHLGELVARVDCLAQSPPRAQCIE